MKTTLNPPLRPRHVGPLRVLTIERISTVHQDERSLDDQRAKSRRFVEDHYEGAVEWRSIHSRSSGEVTDRDSFREMEDLIESGWPDLIVVEDLGRICRRVEALMICELCQDKETRLVALNDHVDTADPNWKPSAMFATLHHERHNQDTSDRIRRSVRNRFQNGSILVVLPYGYLCPEGAKTDDQLTKDPDAEPIYERWFAMLEDGASYSEVADWLNDAGIPVGSGCRSDKWTPRMVSRVTHNPILKGRREWNRKVSKRHNGTGRRRSVKAPPEELLTRECPHLTFVEPARYDRILRTLDARNEGYRRGKQHAKDQRQGVPRSRTVWPGQSIKCGICGRMLYYGAHGQTDRLMCSGAIGYQCWNGASANGPDAGRRICDSVLELIRDLPEFDDALIDEVRQEVDRLNQSSNERIGQIGRELGRIKSEIENVLKYIRSGETSRAVASNLEQLETMQLDLRAELEELSSSQAKAIELPPASEIRSRGLKLFSECAKGTPEFGRLMSRFVENLVVYPVQLIDGGKVSLRATFTVNLLHLVEGGPMASRLNVESMRVERSVDLFEVPQRVAYRAQVAKLSKLDGESGPDLTEREIAATLGITQPAVLYAKRLHLEMKQRGLDDPYQVLTEPPVMGKLRRHRHPRYRFEPLE